MPRSMPNKAAGPWVLKPVPRPTPEIDSTPISRDLLDKVVAGITTLPPEFHLHPKLDGFIKKAPEALRE